MEVLWESFSSLKGNDKGGKGYILFLAWKLQVLLLHHKTGFVPKVRRRKKGAVPTSTKWVGGGGGGVWERCLLERKRISSVA